MRLAPGLAPELLTARRERGLTQAGLAELTGIDQSDISRIEAGNANPTLRTLARLGAALRVSLHALMPEQAEMLELVSSQCQERLRQ
jgi:transcriptional regulator with XRE-family HTH domain